MFCVKTIVPRPAMIKFLQDDCMDVLRKTKAHMQISCMLCLSLGNIQMLMTSLWIKREASLLKSNEIQLGRFIRSLFEKRSFGIKHWKAINIFQYQQNLCPLSPSKRVYVQSNASNLLEEKPSQAHWDSAIRPRHSHRPSSTMGTFGSEAKKLQPSKDSHL